MLGKVKMVIKKQEKNFRRKAVWVSLFGLMVLFLLAFWGIFLPLEKNCPEKLFIVKMGQGLKDIASNLKNEGLIRSANLFKLTALASGSGDQLLAGAYHLSPAMSMADILASITKGEVVKEEMVIIEGWNLNNIAQALEEKEMFAKDDLFAATGRPAVDLRQNSDLEQPLDFAEKFDFLKEKPSYVSLEGYLFPDTYQIARKQTAPEIVAKALSNFSQKITPEILAQISQKKLTLFQTLTMASLLEKEVKTYQDKQIVAGILWKRLNNGWPLQVDASITYFTGKASSQITKEDLKLDSPYNTYLYKGLPLGPICSPGLESILAALNQKTTSYWYYLTTPAGETIFSRTLDEHNYYKRKYLK